jgi:hypothetical protein
MFIGDMCHGIRFQVFIHLGSKMHENKSLMRFIQHFSKQEDPPYFGGS